MDISWDKWNKLPVASQKHPAFHPCSTPNLSPISLALKVQKVGGLPWDLLSFVPTFLSGLGGSHRV